LSIFIDLIFDSRVDRGIPSLAAAPGESYRERIKSGSLKAIRLPARGPNLNSYAERWVRSVKEECLAKPILLGELSLRRALQQFFAALP